MIDFINYFFSYNHSVAHRELKWYKLMCYLGFSGGSVVKNLPVRQETQVQSLSQEGPLEKEMATHSSILAWETSWTEKPAATAAKSLQPCLTLCNPINGTPPGVSVPGILQARTLELGAISFSNAWKWKVKVKSLSPVRLLATPWTVAYQAPPSMGFSRQEYWSGVPLPSLAPPKRRKLIFGK